MKAAELNEHLGQHSLKPHLYPRTLDSLAKFQPPSADERRRLYQRARGLLRERGATIIAHYYTDESIQQLAEETGGYISDSLEMARFGAEHPASTLIVAGVRFMGETAKILSPDKTVLMPELEATCSLDVGCPPDRFSQFRAEHPNHVAVVYANTSAAVKAQADWVVTSSIAVEVVRHLDEEGKQVLWAPDRHLGHHIERQTGVEMAIWDGACVVHEEFKIQGLDRLRRQNPGAGLLVHPESPYEMRLEADAVGSTSQLIAAAQSLPHSKFIVATDSGIFYKMRQAAPEKEFIAAPTAGAGATCRSCAHCPWMAMNGLAGLVRALEGEAGHEISVEPELAQRALVPLARMLEFKAR